MIKTIILLIFIILLNSCVAMPVMNTAIPMKEGEERTTLSGGVFIETNKSTEQVFLPYAYGSLAYKFENIGVEFTLNGVKLIEDLYLSNNLYIASFQSAYLILIGVGGNAGLLFSYRTNVMNFYTSGRFEGFTIKSDGMHNMDYNYLYFIPSAGMSFGNDDTKIFLECFFLKTLVDTQKADEDEFMVLLGLSF